MKNNYEECNHISVLKWAILSIVKHPSFSSMEELASVKLGMIACMYVESECVQQIQCQLIIN